MKLIKTFMAAALLSTAIAGSVMAAEDYSKLDKGTVKLAAALPAFHIVEDGDEGLKKLTLNAAFGKALLEEGDDVKFGNETTEKLHVGVKAIYKHLHDAASVGDADQADTFFAKVDGLSVSGLNIKENLDKSEKDLGVDEETIAHWVKAVSQDPVKALISEEANAKIIADIEGLRKYGVEAAKHYWEALDAAAHKESAEDKVSAYKALFAEVGKDAKFSDLVAEEASETLPREVHARKLKAAMETEKTTPVQKTGAALLAALQEAEGEGDLGAFTPEFRKLNKKALVEVKFSEDGFNADEFVKAALATIQSVSKKVTSLAAENIALARKVALLEAKPASVPGQQRSGHEGPSVGSHQGKPPVKVEGSEKSHAYAADAHVDKDFF